jgi:hypothetical protein
MIAESTNRALSAVGDPQVDGLLGGDVLTAVGALIDYADGRLYVRAGSARARSAIGGELEFATRDVRLPTGSDPDRVKGWDKVRIYVSSDRGKTWASAGEYAPSASEVRYQAPRDGEYWVAAQFVRTDGRAEPAGPEGLTARWKVRVETTRPSVRPDPPPADLREEAIALRREVERLRQRVRDLEAGKR